MPLQNTLHVFHWNIITGTLVRYSSEKYHPNHILPCTFTGYLMLKRKSKHQSRAQSIRHTSSISSKFRSFKIHISFPELHTPKRISWKQNSTVLILTLPYSTCLLTVRNKHTISKQALQDTTRSSNTPIVFPPPTVAQTPTPTWQSPSLWYVCGDTANRTK